METTPSSTHETQIQNGQALEKEYIVQFTDGFTPAVLTNRGRIFQWIETGNKDANSSPIFAWQEIVYPPLNP